MITKEQAQAILDECGDPNCQTTECELARTVIALHERVERLTDAGTRALALLRADGRGDADIAMSLADALRATTHD